jgi:NAD(P)H-dependent FMN reductase
MTRVVVVAGSLREQSYTRLAGTHVLEGVESAGAEGEVLDLREWDLPPLNPDVDGQGDAVAFARTVADADAVVLGTPMYHGSFSGVLKNALDHCGFDEFEGKTVGILGVSGGAFPVTALEHLRSVCRALNAWVLPYQAAVPNSHAAFVDGEFRDEDLRERVVTLGRRTVEYATIEPDPPTFESEQNEGA